jgi:hypothetical protein
MGEKISVITQVIGHSGTLAKSWQISQQVNNNDSHYSPPSIPFYEDRNKINGIFF